jgi:hypothetical protein
MKSFNIEDKSSPLELELPSSESNDPDIKKRISSSFVPLPVKPSCSDICFGLAALAFDPLDGSESLNMTADKVPVPPHRAIGGESPEAP